MVIWQAELFASKKDIQHADKSAGPLGIRLLVVDPQQEQQL